MSQILGTDISEDSVHSHLICKKCFKLFDEGDELAQRLNEIKTELINSYNKSIQRNSDGENVIDEDEKPTDEEATNEQNQTESNKENEVPKKILDIPSSDDDTQVCDLIIHIVIHIFITGLALNGK